MRFAYLMCIVFWLCNNGCAITEATLPMSQGTAHIKVIRPIWTNYILQYHHKADETNITMATQLEHIDGKQLGLMIGTAIDAALKIQGIP